MRTNIVIDDSLINAAMIAAGVTTKKAAVERGLELLVRQARQIQALNSLADIGWDGDLQEIRTDRAR